MASEHLSVVPEKRPNGRSFAELLQKMIRGEMPPAPVAKLLGLELLLAENGRAEFALNADERHANPMGTLHGGVVVDLADAAMGCAVASALEPGESFTTIELKANFFKPIWRARLVASACIVRRTRKLAYVECDVVDDGGSLVARSSSTCMVLSGDEAAGR